MLITDGHSESFDDDMSVLCKHIQEQTKRNISITQKNCFSFHQANFINKAFVSQRFIYLGATSTMDYCSCNYLSIPLNYHLCIILMLINTAIAGEQEQKEMKLISLNLTYH